MSSDPGRAHTSPLPPLLTALDTASLALWWFTADGPAPAWSNHAATALGAPPTVDGRPVAELVATALAGGTPVVPPGRVTLHTVHDGRVAGVLVVVDEGSAPAPTTGPAESAAQQVLLPATLPLLARARVSGAYRPASRAGAAGGDWYDAVAVGEGRLALAVGDGTGAGLGAAAAMSRLRGAWLAEVHRDPRPDVVLAALDRLAAGMDDVRGSALCTVLLDTTTGEVRWSAAGAPAPVLAAAEESAHRAPGSARPPLGSVPEAVVPVYTATLAEGAVLVLVSDGALTVDDRTPDQAWAALLDVAGRVANADRDAVADGRLAETVTGSLLPAGGSDDVAALVVLRVHPVEDLALALDARPASLPAVRRSLERWLTASGMGETERAAVQVAVGEACANAVEHAYPDGVDGRLWVTAHADDDGGLTVTVTDAGRWRTPDRDPGDRGRGLLIMRQLTDEVAVETRAEGGTTVRLRARLCGVPDVPEPAFDDDETDGAVGEVDRTGDLPVVTGTGVLDPTAAPQLRIRLLEACRGGAVPARLDLRAVTELSSAAVTVVLQVARMARTEGWELAVAAPAGSVARHVLDLAGVGAVASLA
ncbi:SpoIIE family protein phosphatase [Geodermatophilus sp. Leaf369]|uniref:SpoIIE family protein phosphatase n=1 Tax=Geodermatophilus sp. Leaf369 TaxID=1736354 RepID=UPI00138EDA9A|nr:SpoIIE family protein phosphatase [Geodermatophilus sp. Leaf369]